MPIFLISRLLFFSFLISFFWIYVKAYDICLQTIGQAYEDMQTQNQHLLEQLADREDFNIKVCISSPFNHFYIKTANSCHIDWR
jgi:hypothetical protein